MWIRKNDGTMENVNISNYPHTKDKVYIITLLQTGKPLYNYEKQQRAAESNLKWLLKELEL